ncbi:hypothetical protein AX14_009037 [Amanita brunnescens Koide BX004]|nr:hypothetical protein AX14_009037 [Amanita brunnescens Koide BX004]
MRSYTRRTYRSPQDECEEECMNHLQWLQTKEECMDNCLKRPYGPAHRGIMPDPPRLEYPPNLAHSYSSPGPPQSPASDQEDGPQHSASPPVRSAEEFRASCETKCSLREWKKYLNDCIEVCMSRRAEGAGYPKYTPKLDPKNFDGVVKDPMPYYEERFEQCIARTARKDRLYYEPNIDWNRNKHEPHPDNKKPGPKRGRRGRQAARAT